MIVWKTTTESNQTSNRNITSIYSMQCDTNTLTKTTNNNLLRINTLINFFLNKGVNNFTTLFNSSTFIISFSIPSGEIKLNVIDKVIKYPSMMLGSISACQFNFRSCGTNETGCRKCLGEINSIWRHKEA